MPDPVNIERLSRASAEIDAARRIAAEAITGHVAIHAAPERGATTKRLFNNLSAALSSLVAADREVSRLLNEEYARG